MPVLRLGNAAGVLPGNDLIHAHFAMGKGMIAHFHADPAPPHFLCDGSSGTGTKERIKNQIAGIGGYADDAFNQTLRLGGIKRNITSKQSIYFVLRLTSVADFVLRPPRPRYNSLCFR